jgi:ethanolamine utilization cobalamin adenosyltransferase
MSSSAIEMLPSKRLFTPVAPSLLHERQFNLLIIKAQQSQQSQQSQQLQQSQQSTGRRHSSSEKNTKRKPTNPL